MSAPTAHTAHTVNPSKIFVRNPQISLPIFSPLVYTVESSQRYENMTHTKRVGLYLRVSTDDQTIENQRAGLVEAISRRPGWTIVNEFSDNGISGVYGRDKRPGFDRLLKAATRREIDIVAAWSVDRLGRSLQHLVSFLAELDAVGCDLYLHQQSLDTTTPAGRALFQMLGVFSEFERAMIRDRVKAGMARARRDGTKSGKPIGGRPLPQEKVAEIVAELQRGTGILKTAKLCGTGTSAVQKIKRAMLWVAANPASP